jgi:hypothetical protein
MNTGIAQFIAHHFDHITIYIYYIKYTVATASDKRWYHYVSQLDKYRAAAYESVFYMNKQPYNI